jgi:uncharacterized membrane protein
MTLFTLEFFFRVVGVFLLGVAIRVAANRAHPTRWGSALFWVVLAVIFGGGRSLPPVAVGALVVLLVVLAAVRQVTPPPAAATDDAALEREADRLGNRLLGPVLLVPAMAIVIGLFFGGVSFGSVVVIEAKPAAQIGLGLGCLVAVAWALRLTRERPVVAFDEGGRLLQLISWTILLPQMLAALGGIFARAGVGDVIAQLVAAAVPVQHPFVAVFAYCAGMAGFTILLGNAFAAFPIMTLGIGLPFVVQAHGGNPAVLGALGMLAGYCGTLVTPMAANFNLVPVRLLELPHDLAVIRAQAPFAAVIWIFNVVVMYVCVYRF